jgi:hypothetical protein
MKIKIILGVVISSFLFSFCTSKKNIPDVSSIKIDLKILRFEKDLFALDTANLSPSLDVLNQKYISFLPDYLYSVLALTPRPEATINELKLFLKDSMYRSIYQDATKKFVSLDEVQAELIFSLKLTKYYFPKYQIPINLYTFIGPVDGVGTAITSDHSFAVGLQGYLGKDYPIYQDAYIAQTYPPYKTRRFEERYIATNCIKNVIEELFPDKSNGRPLAERMIEQGRRLFLLDALLPTTADTIKTGYTKKQLKECFDNEKAIWAFFVSNNLLFEREPSRVSPFVTDGPKTQELSETAPGNIGQFTGWQIVKKWMEANPKMSLAKLMSTPVMTIFNEANYKP